MREKTKKNVSKTYTDPITGKFVKGNPGGGRPKGSRSFTTKVKLALEKIADGKSSTYEEELIKSILEKAVSGDFATQKLIWNYLDGLPRQEKILLGDEDYPLTFKFQWQQSQSPTNQENGQNNSTTQKNDGKS